MTPLDSLRHRTGWADSPAGGAGSSVGEGSLIRGGKRYYVYVLQSEKDGNFYVGFTCNLERRIKEHNKGENQSTSSRRPFRLIYYEVCLDGRDAVSREKYLKSSWGKRYIKNRIRNCMKKTPLDNLRYRTGRADSPAGRGCKNG